MSTTNQMIIEKLFRIVEAQDWAAALELVSPGLKAHIGGQTLDREQWLGFAQQFMTGFPDGRHDFEDIVVAGDRVVALVTFHGTHTGPFLGTPPTGNKIRFPAILVDRVIDGRLVEHRGEFDSAILMRQLGLLPG